MDNATENNAANRAVLREDRTLDPNAAAALLEGALNAVMDERASELGAVRDGCACVGRIAPRNPRLREGVCFPDGIVERRSGTDSAPAGGPAPTPTSCSRPPRRSCSPTSTSRASTAGACLLTS